MGSVNKQTDAYLRGIKSGNPQKIGFGGRLYMHVSPTGSPTTGGMSTILWGDCELCFPSPRTRSRHITSESLMCALKDISSISPMATEKI
jgi:hypothetical protein